MNIPTPGEARFQLTCSFCDHNDGVRSTALPIELHAKHTKRLESASGWLRSVLAATGQPAQFTDTDKSGGVPSSRVNSSKGKK